LRTRFFADVAEKPRFTGALRGFSRNLDLTLQVLKGKGSNHKEMSETTYQKLLAAWRFDVVHTQGGVLFIGPHHFFSLPHEPRTKAERKVAIAHIRALCKL
tara:strand:- start:422 stop:724 length:303 start_codon:yes stop_codon:yes gene_type:complete